jgi:S1-C subfamily serine protease
MLKGRKYDLFAKARRPRRRLPATFNYPPETQLVFDPGEAPPLLVRDMGLLDAYSNAVVDAVETVGPAVVRVIPIVPDGYIAGEGSGFFVSTDGLILTNRHVIAGVNRFAIITADGHGLTARPIGEDADTDIAVLRL